MIDLNQFATWQAKDPEDRNVKIIIEGNPGDVCNLFNPWIYVYSKRKGISQSVRSVEEIDFDASHEKEERAEYERLKAKFGDGSECPS